MAKKTDKTTIDDNGDNRKKDRKLLSELMKKAGALPLKDSGRVPWYHDMGNLALNYICSGKLINGGLPGGRIIEVFGAEATAKTLLGYVLMSNTQKQNGVAVHIDVERSGNAEFAETTGLDSEEVFTYFPEHYKAVQEDILKAVKHIRSVYKDEPISVVLDSIGVISTERESKTTDWEIGDKKADKESKEQPGERARAAGNFLRVINPFLNDNKATLYVINQIRSKVGVMFGSPETTAGGGKALPFYASTRLKMVAQKKILHAKFKTPLGVRLKVQNKKSRSFTPGLETFGIKLYYGHGIDPLSGLLSVLVNAGRIEGKGGNYKVLEPWAGGKTVTFKASAADERNEMPAEPILECPALIDAESREQVEAYLGRWTAAMNLSSSEDVAEEDFADETDNLLGGDDYASDEDNE